MNEDTTQAHGLFVSGTKVTGSDEHYHRYVKYLTINPEDRKLPAFEQGGRKALAKLEDPKRREIFDALQAAEKPMEYASLNDADLDFTMRQQAIHVMTKFNTGAMDADYFDPGPVKIHPRIGSTFYDSSQGSWRNGPFWQTSDVADPWDFNFDQRNDTTASAAMLPIFPFRGECAGAVQICVFKGAVAALGDGAFDDEHPDGSLEVGPWASDVRMYLQKVPLTDPLIPGDYLYFKNKDDYSKYAPNGFWTGLNCLYVGMDGLATKRYSGLGASWQTETELRATMKNAYMGDCYPHRVDDPNKEIRFTVHARLVLGAAKPARRPAAERAAMAREAAALPPAPRPTPGGLRALNFVEHEDGVFVRDGVRLKDLADGLGFHHAMLTQAPSAPLANPVHRVSVGGVPCIVDYREEEAGRHEPETIVRAIVNLNVAASVESPE